MEEFPKQNPNPEYINNEGEESQKPKSFTKHMAEMAAREKSFDELRRDGEVPEGVRDEQDYKEYLEEQQAKNKEILSKLGESQEFVQKYYYPDKYTGHDKEDLEKFINSEELMIIAQYGFTLPELAEKGIISKDRYEENGKEYWRHFRTDELFRDTENIVSCIADCLSLHSDGLPFAIKMKEVFNKWDNPQTLNTDDYDFINEIPLPTLSSRLKFGNPNYLERDTGNQDNKSIYEHTMKTLVDWATYDGRLSRDYNEYEVASDMLHVANHILPKDKADLSEDHRRDIEAALGVTANECLSSNGFSFRQAVEWLDGPDQETLKDLMLGSLTKREIFEAPIKADLLVKNDSESGGHCFISVSERELLEAVYDLDYEKEKPKKIFGARSFYMNIIEDFPKLVDAGFNRQMLVDIIHDECNQYRYEGDSYFGVRRAMELRKNGMSDMEIAYILLSGLNSPLGKGESSAAIRELGISSEDVSSARRYDNERFLKKYYQKHNQRVNREI